jgi:hypothetical protein
MILYDFFVQHGFVFEMLVCVALLTWWMERRRLFALRFIISVAALLGTSLLWSLLPVQNAWSKSLWYVLALMVCLGAVVFCFRTNVKRALFQVTAAGAVQHFAFKAASAAEFFRFTGRKPGFMEEVFTYPSFLIVFLILIYLLFARRLNREELDGIERGAVIQLLVAMLLFVDLFQNFFDEYSIDIGMRLYTIFELFDLVCCLFMLALQCEIAKREIVENNNAILEHVLHQQKKQMETSKETMELINIKCHDIKNQIALLGNRVSQEEIDELNQAVSSYVVSVKTGNEALDILLTEKHMACESRRIAFEYMVDGNSLSFMKPSDIYSLFGNLIDNAIEASEKVEEQSKRRIGLRVCEEKGMLLIHVENSYTGTLNFEKDLPQTTKADKRYHGFGMKSIKLITGQYDGFMKIKVDGQLFTINILLPMQKQFDTKK